MNHTRQKYLLILIFAGLLHSFSLKGYTYLFSHGFGETYRQAYRYAKTYKWLGKTYKNQNYILYTPIKLFNYPDSLWKGLPPKLNKTSLAQKNEIVTLKNAYDEIEDENIILFGTSRGASVVLNFAGIHNTDKLKAIVAESPFDNVKSVFNTHWFVNIASKLISKPKIYKFFLWATKHKEEGEHPIDNVIHIRNDLPVMLICTESDEIVPCSSTINLYKKLCENGHKHVYLLKFKTGKHGKLLWTENGIKCRNVVHAFYAKYHLPHNPEFAKQGKNDLEQECQPTLKELQ